MAEPEAPENRPPDDRRVAAFRPIQIQKAADAVVAVLADAIRGGLYQPGDMLPRERDLAERLEVSRPVVREAIDVLRRGGVVTVKRGPSGGAMLKSVDGLRSIVADLRGELRDSMLHVAEMRRLLDYPVALLAAERADDEHLASLTPLVEDLCALPEDADADRTARVDAAFHSAVGHLTGNPLLAAHYQSILDQAVALTRQFPMLIVPVKKAGQNQRELHAAITSRDSRKIERAVTKHLDAFEQIYLVDLPQTPRAPKPRKSKRAV